jgi:hypothetical protein
MIDPAFQRVCTAITPSSATRFHMEGKNRNVLRFLRPYKISGESERYCRRPPVDSASFTNTYRRTVIIHSSLIGSKVNRREVPAQFVAFGYSMALVSAKEDNDDIAQLLNINEL